MKIRGLNYVAVYVKNLDQAVKLYSDLFGLAMPRSGPYSVQIERNEPGHKTKARLLELPNDSYLELVQPVEGPGVKFLQEMGEGTIRTLGFGVDSIEEAYDEMKRKGITPLDQHGPITDRKYILGLKGEKLFFLPPEKTGGTRMELVQLPLNYI